MLCLCFEVTFLQVEMVHYFCISLLILAIILAPVCIYESLYSKKATGTFEKVLKGKNRSVVKRSKVENLCKKLERVRVIY